MPKRRAAAYAMATHIDCGKCHVSVGCVVRGRWPWAVGYGPYWPAVRCGPYWPACRGGRVTVVDG